MFHAVTPTSDSSDQRSETMDTSVVFHSFATEYLQVTAGLATDKPGVYVVRVFLLAEPVDLDRIVGETRLKKIMHVQRMMIDPNAFYGLRLMRVKAVFSKKIRGVTYHRYEYEDGHVSWSDPDIPRFGQGRQIYQDVVKEVGVHVRFDHAAVEITNY